VLTSPELPRGNGIIHVLSPGRGDLKNPSVLAVAEGAAIVTTAFL